MNFKNPTVSEFESNQNLSRTRLHSTLTELPLKKSRHDLQRGNLTQRIKFQRYL